MLASHCRTDHCVRDLITAGPRPRRFGIALLSAAVMVVSACGPVMAAMPDYALLDEVLLQNVRNGYVDYDGIDANPRFAEFLRQLAAAPDGFDTRAAELSYYINAYNAFAIRAILDGYSPATRIGRHRYFRSARFRLAGKDITLEELEHQRIRPMSDPRIHFAIACASLSCPRLSNRAYLPDTLDAQLDEATRRFINDVTRNRFDIPQKTAFVSEIFDWFGADFARAAGSLPDYLARYVQEPAARAALTEGRLAIRHLPYDWDLNGHYTGPAN
jgi:hypothetical protein